MDDNQLLTQVYEKVGGLHAKLDAYHEEMTKVRGRVTRLERKWAKAAAILSLLSLPFTALLSLVRPK